MEKGKKKAVIQEQTEATAFVGREEVMRHISNILVVQEALITDYCTAIGALEGKTAGEVYKRVNGRIMAIVKDAEEKSAALRKANGGE